MPLSYLDKVSLTTLNYIISYDRVSLTTLNYLIIKTDRGLKNAELM